VLVSFLDWHQEIFCTILEMVWDCPYRSDPDLSKGWDRVSMNRIWKNHAIICCPIQFMKTAILSSPWSIVTEIPPAITIEIALCRPLKLDVSLKQGSVTRVSRVIKVWRCTLTWKHDLHLRHRRVEGFLDSIWLHRGCETFESPCHISCSGMILWKKTWQP
jgi:hypothetical protein